MEQEKLSFIENYEPVIKAIRLCAKDYLSISGRKSVILGVSGGIDSALVAALIRPVCDSIGIPLIGVSLPTETNDKLELTRAQAIGESFCHNFNEVPITNMYWSLCDDLLFPAIKNYADECIEHETISEMRVRKGNIKARIRMIYLFNLAQLYQGLVLSTDNLTELLLGFWTLHGDVGNFGMIQNMWKTEVYNMSEYLCENELTGPAKDALQACIDCHATDGLGVSKSDLDQIMPDWADRHQTTRSGYKEVDEALITYIKTGTALTNHQVIINRHKRTEFKRIDPTNITRNELLNS